MERRDWLTVAVAVVAAVAILATFVVMQGKVDGVEAQLREAVAARDALTAAKDKGVQDAKDLRSERNRLQRVVMRQQSTIGDLRAKLHKRQEPASVVTYVNPSSSQPGAGSYGPGVYYVGSDIAPGRYKGEPNGAVPYWEISRDANGMDIVANDLPHGTFYLQVKAGQYLYLQDVTITGS